VAETGLRVFAAYANLWAGVDGLRGGSWNNNEDNARVAIRNNNHPNNRNNNIGFRVAVLHSSVDVLCQKYVLSYDKHRGITGWLPARLFHFYCVRQPNIKNSRLFQ
jgi:hypothetical protein